MSVMRFKNFLINYKEFKFLPSPPDFILVTTKFKYLCLTLLITINLKGAQNLQLFYNLYYNNHIF